ncbi:efflux RND transporter permease subunit [Plectonema cf. radiosum LEGE 06105]|uniref:Efflux RND transporter permease subunit n=1 Tax=Plectonema cf. radiosum LEGE 06105 TaxID=945769 RepID=A0A8J7F723_9CYAN|nr:efflux RND transporter permease subunit [Plectonema radiosum]MBE9216868.1 efflux RND transporter permease subunit [Plectonema cf. radiosum LEGE 06105]
MFTLFYRNSRLLILTIILIAVWGISAYFTLPRLEDPELVSRTAVVSTFFPGANAERVEALVTEKIEDKLTEIEEIDNYQSTSRTSSSLITIELQDTVSKQQVDSVWTRIRNKLDEAQVELPNNTSKPELEAVKVKAYALIAGLTWEQNDKPNYGILRRQAEVFKERLEAISGTEEVEIFGEPQEEITVEINPQALASYNLTASELSQQIAQSDSKISAGQLRDNDNNLLIQVAGELDTLARIRQIPINFGSQGQFVNLQNIATISKGITEPATELALLNGHPGVAVAVHVQSGKRLDLWSEVAEKKIAEFQSELPSSIGLPIVFAQSGYVEERLNSLIANLLLGAGLVFAVTVIMMGLKSAIIVSSALPLSVFMVFGWMNWLNIPLHQMSITGLIVALGILIDNAIVMVDEVTNELRQGIKPKAAINHSIQNLAIPLLSSTLTTVLAFLPIALLPGSTGEFVGTIAITVIVAVCCSLFISLTIVPAFAAKFYRHQDSKKKLSWLQNGISIPLLTRLYRRTVKFTIAKPILSIMLALLIPVMGFVQAGSLEQQFFPAADRDQLQIQLELPASVSLAKTQTLIQQIRQQIIKNPEVKDVHWLLGRSIPSFYYNLTGGKEQQPNYAQALVQLNSLTSSHLAKKIQTELDKAFPTARIIVRQLEQGPPFDAPIEMRIYGSNVETLQSLGEKVRQSLVQIKDVTHTRASLDEIQPQIEWKIDEEQARLAGLSRTTIAQQLDSSLEGVVGGSILEANEELPVRVRLGQERSNLSQISSLDLLATSSINRKGNNPLAAVPLSSLGKVQLKPELAQITHYNGQRVNTVQAFLNAGVLPAEILNQFQAQLENNKFALPPGYKFEFGGEQEQRNDAVGGLVSTVGVLIILMIATLVLSLGSFQLAGVIGIVAIASFGLGLFSIWLFDYPFGFNPIIGSVGLIGVAVNDSIVVISAISNHPIAKTGNPQAIQEVVLHSTRHVLTTTLTTAIGFVPLLLSGGEFWPPLAVAIAGGVVGATFLALYFVPAAYYLIKLGFGKKRFSFKRS